MRVLGLTAMHLLGIVSILVWSAAMSLSPLSSGHLLCLCPCLTFAAVIASPA